MLQHHRHRLVYFVLSGTYFVLYTVLAVEGELTHAAWALVAAWAYLLTTPGGGGRS